MPHYPQSEKIHFSMPLDLYDELIECEVDSYELNEETLQGSHVQFVQAMLHAQTEDYKSMVLSMTHDGFDHLTRKVLPEIMEMWYSTENYDLIQSSRAFLESCDLSCPY